MMTKEKIENGCIFHPRTNEYSYSYTRAAGLNEYGDVNLTTYHTVWFAPPTDGRGPEIGDFVNVGTSFDDGAGNYLETGTFERRVGYQSTEGRMRWPSDPEPYWYETWEQPPER